MTCPVCNSSVTEFLGTIDRFKDPFSIRLCKNCHSYYQYPLPKSIISYYNEDYYSGVADFRYIDERKSDYYSRFVWKARLKNIRKFQSKGKFLDVGCSFGGFVRTATSYFHSFGIDISSYAVQQGNEFAKNFDLNKNFGGLFRGSLMDIPPEVASAAPFNVITLIEVAEHLENPEEHFQRAFNLLAPGGLLVIQTANMSAVQAIREGLGYHYFLPGHLTYFSREGLTDLLFKTGFLKLKEYFPVDFGILPKLKKMSGNLHGIREYTKMGKTILYHFSSYFKVKGIPRTSSYVVYALK